MDEQPEEMTGPLVERPVYPTPRRILQRGRPPRMDSVVVRSQALARDQEGPPMDPESTSPGIPRTMSALAKQEAAIEIKTVERYCLSPRTRMDPARVRCPIPVWASCQLQRSCLAQPQPRSHAPDLDPTPDEDLGYTAADHSRAERLGRAEDEQICYHEGGDLYAEDVGEDMAVVPDVPLTTEEVKIEDIQLDSTSNTPEDVNRLRAKPIA
ncbi:hypothetical protein PC129_g9654 [Phytophthora cactorum]|uniref:Uncharacterized protein n=2 Tax=Phytophthora cactorum TaxID=29920 RepID=A0A8T1I5G6_9STRA|nr:hypothetical protein PC129_g9654 [Phytophthora cactorum]